MGTCSHCGRAERRVGWADRHPAATVTAGLFSLTLMAMMFSVHPIAAGVMTALAGVVGAVYLIERERSRRAALAARAEHQYRQLLAVPAPVLPPADGRPRTLPWQLAARLQTEPIHARGTRCRMLTSPTERVREMRLEMEREAAAQQFRMDARLRETRETLEMATQYLRSLPNS
jgi:hypothetical protein